MNRIKKWEYTATCNVCNNEHFV